jgi:hypothetical protein
MPAALPAASALTADGGKKRRAGVSQALKRLTSAPPLTEYLIRIRRFAQLRSTRAVRDL